MNTYAKQVIKTMQTKFVNFDQLCLFFDQNNYNANYIHMVTSAKRLDETNLMMHGKKNFKVKKAPKMELVC